MCTMGFGYVMFLKEKAEVKMAERIRNYNSPLFLYHGLIDLFQNIKPMIIK